MANVIDITGRVFGRLTVLSFKGIAESGHAQWLCRCSCGEQTVLAGYILRRKTAPQRSCGCLLTESYGHSVTHGRTRTGTWVSWAAMRARCLRAEDKDYPEYGGAGVTVCDRWNPAKGGSFENFLEDMGERPKGTTLSRLADSGNYEPGNCVWGTREHQIQERRKKNNGSYFATK